LGRPIRVGLNLPRLGNRAMSGLNVSPEIERLIALLAKLPGLGPRSARRAALDLLKKPDALMRPLGLALGEAAEKISVCQSCGNVDAQNPCQTVFAPKI